jgi:hypothetical protein
MIRRLIARLVERYRRWVDDRAMKRWRDWQQRDFEDQLRRGDPLP